VKHSKCLFPNAAYFANIVDCIRASTMLKIAVLMYLGRTFPGRFPEIPSCSTFYWKANMNIFRSIIVVLLTLTASSFAQTSPTPTGGAQMALASALPTGGDDRYRIGLQDVLTVQVFRHPELTITAPVNPNGTIFLFRLEQPVVALCKTERELAADIAAAYKVKYLRDPQVNVVVSEQKSQSMSVIGAVEKPGTFFLNRRVQLLSLLALAGGPNKESGTRLMVVRAGSTSNCRSNDETGSAMDEPALMGFKIRDVQEGKKTLWMQPGDVVSVLDADMVYVYGNVVKPGELKVREPITLTQAIASSEGLKPATEKDKVRILRQKADSIEREEILVDLAAVEKGKAKDPYLEPNDIVAVSKDKAKDIFLSIRTAITNGIPTVLSRGIPVP